MVRIPVTLADFESGRIKSSISKLSKYHPDQPVKPKRSVVQQTFAQVLGYGGYEELRSQAKQNGPAYSGQSLAIEQFIAPISLRISRYWSVSAEKAENIAAALGLMHLDAFRPTVRAIQQPIMQDDRVSPRGRLPNLGISPRPVFDAVRRATLMPMTQIEALQGVMRSMHMAALQDALSPSAQMAAIQEVMKPMGQIAALGNALKPSVQMLVIQEVMKPMAHSATLGDAMKSSAQMLATQEIMKPMAHLATLGDAMKPSAQMLAIQEVMKPMAHLATLGDAMKPSAQMLAIQEVMKPMAHLATLGDAMKPSAQMLAIQEIMKPMAHIAAILDALKSTPH
ncbi:hypothetical protein [Pseudomonas sp. FW300-N2F2]|uniref:hypothetical protein n=1 Tax=Pseudomonas sp. FW300-N2F2 TaxID=2751320 RepID=UPI001A91D440|nr:hypothetical protein [Pseudomonas sp. FW300-N2F2]